MQGIDRFIISAPSFFQKSDVAELTRGAPSVVSRYVPEYEQVCSEKGWRMFDSIGRVYDSTRARAILGWEPDTY